MSPEAAPFWSDAAVVALLQLAGAHFDVPLHTGQAMASPFPNPLPQVPETYWQGDPRHVGLLQKTFPSIAALAGTPILNALHAAWKHADGWLGLLDLVRLGHAQDLLRAKAEHVQIMTLHASKGLEFRAVFLPALEEGILPFFGVDALLKPGSSKPADSSVLAEERRLLYVGITRASEAVFASHTAKRLIYGKELRLPASRFVEHLPDTFRKSRLKRQIQKSSTQLSLLD